MTPGSPTREFARMKASGPLRVASSLAAVGLALLASLAGRLHEVLEPHAICVEHGDVVELAGAPEVHDDAHDGGPRWSRLQADRRDHEHCPFAALGRGRALHAVCAPSVSIGTGYSLERPRPSVEVRQSVPLLSLAPKHSPPEIA